MTKNVSISITVEIADKRRYVIQKVIQPDQMGKELKEISEQLIQTTGREIISSLDDDIKEHEAKGLKVLGTENREFSTIYGTLSYTRRVYRGKDGRRFKPVDELLGLEPYARRDQNLQELHCALAGRANYRESAEISTLITQKYVSASTIGRDVRKVGARLSHSDRTFFTEEKGSIASEVLYGESDGIHVRLQKDKDGKKSAEIRAAITYTGKKWISGNRKRLTNKMTLTAMDISSPQWQEMVRNHVFSMYDLSSVKLLAVGGDGGSWVGSTFDLCGVSHIERVLDPFHIKKAIRTAFSGSLDLPSLYDSLFHFGFPAVANSLLPLTKKGNPSVRSARIKCFNYLNYHQNDILPLSERSLPFDHLDSLGCMESNIGKTIALRMKTRGCSWSRDGASAMAAILCHLPELEYHSLRYSHFENEKSLTSTPRKHSRSQSTPQIHKASFPIVSSGKLSKPYFFLFKNIINGCELP